MKNAALRLRVVLKALQEAFPHLLGRQPIRDMRKVDLPWRRWDEGEFARIAHYLEAKHATGYTLDDWLLVVDLLIQRYLPAGVINTEAEYLTVRAAILGKIEANQARLKAQSLHVQDMVEFVPTTFAAVPPRVLTPIERATLEAAKALAAQSIRGISEKTRHAMKQMIVEHVQAQVLGQKEGTVQALGQRLFDSFGGLNLDFYEIARFEMGECSNQGFVAAQAPGAKVRRVEAYHGACKFCRSIDGKVFEVVSPAAPEKDGEKQVWLGKTNICRSASLRKKVNGVMIDRPESEMWWPAAGLQHSDCRGLWLPVSEKPPAVSQEFEDWLQAMVRRK